MTQRIPALAATLLVVPFLLAPGAARAEKTDVVWLKNGDRITCEIKTLARGKLEAKTDGMGTVEIEWDDIARISSRDTFVVEESDGHRTEGVPVASAGDGTLVLQSADGALVTLPLERVVWADPLKAGQPRLKRWDGSVSAGLDATRANNARTVTATFEARRRSDDSLVSVNGSFYSRSQDDADDTLRAMLATGYKGFLPDRWFWALVGSAERNDELGLDLRTLAGAGFGRFLVQTGHSLWSVTAGLDAAHEKQSGGNGSSTELEGLLGTEFEYFTYDTPKTTIYADLSVYPGITDSGRIRLNLDTGVRHELVEDLFLDLSFYDTFDSGAPDADKENDYGFVTSLGYSF